MAEQTCPTCGSRVVVVSTDEGTHHYEPVEREELWQVYLATGADPDGADARHLRDAHDPDGPQHRGRRYFIRTPACRRAAQSAVTL